MLKQSHTQKIAEKTMGEVIHVACILRVRKTRAGQTSTLRTSAAPACRTFTVVEREVKPVSVNFRLEDSLRTRFKYI